MPILSRYSWWVGAMVGFALFLALAGQVGILAPFQSTFLKLTTPIESGLNAVFEPVADYLANVGDLGELRDENRQLQAENEALLNRVTELEDRAARAEELEAALGVTSSQTEDDLLPATVIHRDASPFNSVVAIDRGSSDGIAEGMVVLSAQGTVVGKVTTVLDSRAFVRLLNDSESKVNGEVQETRVRGIVSGSADRQVSFELTQAEIKVGDHIVTSGLGGNYPPGRLIGTVSEVEGTAQDLTRTVSIEPAVRLSTVETVLVLRSFIPQRLDLGE